MDERPYVMLSCAVSVDGRLGGAGPGRLVLSGDRDLDRVDAERSVADAIMVGAGTVRADDPRLLIRSPQRRAARLARGLPAHPVAVTLTASGHLDPAARIFARSGGDAPGLPGAQAGDGHGGGQHGGGGTSGIADRLVYCPDRLVPELSGRLNGLARVIGAGPGAEYGAILADLHRRGIGRLMVEGGARLGTALLAGGLVDELQLAIAPVFVGEPEAPRFAGPATYPHHPGRPMVLAGTRGLDGMVLLRYLLGTDLGAPGSGGEASGPDRRWLRETIELSRRCPPSPAAFAVGAVVVARDGSVLATGHSREGSPHDHAEEAALRKLDPADPRLAGATLYSSLEPCRSRASRPRPCAELIVAAGLRRVVIAWREPPLFAPGGGASRLREAGITVVEVADLAGPARAVNAAVLDA